MPISDAKRIYVCKYCGKEFQMFIRSDGILIFYPLNTPWPVCGDFELISHIRAKHKKEFSMCDLFFPIHEEFINYAFRRV